MNNLKLLLIASLFASCSSRITDANQGVLIRYEKIPRSTYFKVTVRVDSCEDFIAKWNCHGWRVKEPRNIPKTWNVIKYQNGKYFIEPVK